MSVTYTSSNCPPSEQCMFVDKTRNDGDSYILKLLSEFENSQRLISYVLNGYLTLFCVITGTILNIICILVFLKFRQNSNTTIIQWYLITLTGWQTLLLISAFVLYSVPTLIYGKVVLSGDYVFTYAWSYFLSNLSHTGSIWLVLTLTVDRFLALCHPLTHPSIGNRARVKKLMIIVSVSAILFSLPRFFEVAVVYRCNNNSLPSDETMGLLTECESFVYRTSLTRSTIYWRVYRIFLNSIFVTIGPCLILFILTVRISLELNKSGQRRKSLCQSTASECLVVGEIRKCSTADSGRLSSGKDHRANLILVLVILKSTITNLLPSIVDVLEHIVGDVSFTSSPLASVVVDFSNFLLVLNCSTNFWVFLLWGKRFRQSCCYLLFGTRLGMAFAKLVNLESDLVSLTHGTTRTRNNLISSADPLTNRRFSSHESATAFLTTNPKRQSCAPSNRRASEAVNTKNSTKKSKRARSCTDDFIDRQRLLSNVMRQ